MVSREGWVVSLKIDFRNEDAYTPLCLEIGILMTTLGAERVRGHSFVISNLFPRKWKHRRTIFRTH